MAGMKATINSIGLGLTLVGTLIAYLNSPLNVSVIDGGEPGDDPGRSSALAWRRNCAMKAGIFTILFGTGLQLVSNFIPEVN